MRDRIGLLSGLDADHVQSPFRHIDEVAAAVMEMLELGSSDRLGQWSGDSLIAAVRDRSPSNIKSLVDFLSLHGEVLGTLAERDYGKMAAAGQNVPSPVILKAFADSFAAYYVAEELRRALFWFVPNSGLQTIGGRAARGFIRVSVKLERFRATFTRHLGTEPPAGGWFWQHAHRLANELALYLARYPRERVSMLILDATMARYHESFNDKRYPPYLALARENLRRAESFILKLGMHSRLRQRFAHERCKVLAESARLAIDEDRDAARRFLTICEQDLDSFTKIARPDDMLWRDRCAFASTA